MTGSTFLRLVWKEYRLQRGFWISMVVLAGLLFAAVLMFTSERYSASRAMWLFEAALGLSALYALGCGATLFAAEPDVRQPIAMTFDDRGRLWVAESYSYGAWKKEGKDRILIFEDNDSDGHFDSRKVFWDKGDHISSFEIGFGERTHTLFNFTYRF